VSGPVHSYDVVVRWSDEDRLGHVNNARYLTFVEDARLVWLAASPAGNGGVILARSEVDFRRQVHFAAGGRLVVHTDVRTIGRTSMRIGQDILPVDEAGRAGSVAEAVARTVHVLVAYDYDRQVSRPWNDAEREWLQPFVAAPGEG